MSSSESGALAAPGLQGPSCPSAIWWRDHSSVGLSGTLVENQLPQTLGFTSDSPQFLLAVGLGSVPRCGDPGPGRAAAPGCPGFWGRVTCCLPTGFSSHTHTWLSPCRPGWSKEPRAEPLRDGPACSGGHCRSWALVTPLTSTRDRLGTGPRGGILSARRGPVSPQGPCTSARRRSSPARACGSSRLSSGACGRTCRETWSTG